MAKPKPSRPTLRPTSPDVANALRSLDAEQPAVVTTPPKPKVPVPAVPRVSLVPPPEPIRTTANLSVSIATAMRDRIDALAYEQKLGKTAIVEGALSALFEGRSNEQIAKLLRDKGQAFRRRS